VGKTVINGIENHEKKSSTTSNFGKDPEGCVNFED